jgi:GTP pyrophosphokinase
MYNNIKIDENCKKLFDEITNFAKENNLNNTLKALGVAAKHHRNQFRKGPQIIDGKECEVHYLYHCLQVCNLLIKHDIPFSKKELDVLYASALLHDVLEDCDWAFQKGGIELISRDRLDAKVYKTVKTLTKPKEKELLFDYFENIKLNKLALLIKISDRYNNVSDLYNMHNEKLKEYIEETRDYVIPLFNVGKNKYPELTNVLDIYKDQIVTLINTAEKFAIKEELQKENIMSKKQSKLLAELNVEVKKKNEEIKELTKELNMLKKQNKELFRENKRLRNQSKKNNINRFNKFIEENYTEDLDDKIMMMSSMSNTENENKVKGDKDGNIR